MTSEAVREAVARAIYKSHYGAEPEDSDDVAVCLDEADAAIAAHLAALAAMGLVVVPRALMVEAYRDLRSPFPRETQVVASLGTGNTSIEKLHAMLAASPIAEAPPHG